LRTQLPDWNGHDTSVCLGTVVSLKINPGYSLTAFGQMRKGPSEISISDTGLHTWQYALDGCDPVQVSYNLHTEPEDSCGECHWYMPDYFNPNSAVEKNRVFAPVFACLNTSYTLHIYNRWGEEVYSGHNAWDGAYRGHLCPPGVYMYTLEITGLRIKDHFGSGTVQLEE
jgi:gliding motility-associated-like protein